MGRWGIVLVLHVAACSSSAEPSAVADAAGDVASDEGPASDTGSGDPCASTDTWKTPIGSPTWEPFGGQRISIVAGTAKSGYAELFTSIGEIVGPQHRFYKGMPNAWGPGDPHPPPYEGELAAMLASKSIVDRDTFTVDEFTGPKGVGMPIMLVPRCASTDTGSSPDFASGKIIPNKLFPLTITAPLYKGTTLFDPDMTTSYPGPSGFGKTADGFSHVFLLFGDSMEFAPPGATAPGTYEWRIRVVDTTGAGWNIQRTFEVK